MPMIESTASICTMVWHPPEALGSSGSEKRMKP